MKKSLILGIFMCMFIFAPQVYATCEYGIPSPEIYTNGTWRKDGKFDLQTTADSCYGSNTSVTFSNGSYLPMGRFNIHAILYEEDPPGNDDERVKTYKGYNDGYNLIAWSLVSIDNSGKIDSTGDQNCELYMKFKIETIDASPFNIMRSNLFKYTMCMS